MDKTIFQRLAQLADEGRSMMVVFATTTATALLGVVVMSAMAFRLFVVVFMPATALFFLVLVMMFATTPFVVMLFVATTMLIFLEFFSSPRGPRSIREG